MPDNFTAENVDSAGEVFATDAIGGSSIHYPIGKLAWGALNTANLTDTANPFPVQLFGLGASSGTPFYVRGVGDSTVPVSGSVTVSNDSLDPVGVTNNSGNALFVKGTSSNNAPAGDKPLLLGGRYDSTAITYDDGDVATFAVDANGRLFVNLGSDNSVVVSGNASVTQAAGDSWSVTHPGLMALDSAVNSSNHLQVDLQAGAPGLTVGISPNGQSGSNGALKAFTASISSLATTVTTAVTRLYGYYIGNPDSRTSFLKIYPDDSAGVTLGTTAALMDLMAPGEGGANVSIAQGIELSSGMSLAAAGAGGSTDHSSPSSNLIVTVWFTPST